jgi:acyl-CoA thioesterase YciA
LTHEALHPERHPAIRVVAMPAYANAYGDIFGGWLISQVDLAGAMAAIRRARGRVVTVAMKEVEFHRPVLVGDLVSCYAEVTRVGNTSLTVAVEVYAERAGSDYACMKVTHATVVYVAVDERGKPRPVPPEDAGPA